MNQENPDEIEIIEKFDKIKRKQYIAAVPMMFVILFFVFVSRNPDFTLFEITSERLLLIAFLFMLPGIIFSFKNWRCPACESYLGKSFSPSFCPKCGVRLK